jgi:hypothetical protein
LNKYSRGATIHSAAARAIADAILARYGLED